MKIWCRLVVCWLLASLAADGLPQGAQVVNGQVKVNPQGQVLQILQSTPQAIVNWNSFNVKLGEVVRFLQPDTAAAILNRVVGTDPSRILGQLQANGRVILVNPNGILFGPGAVVDAGSFIASTLNISDQDFLAKRMRFAQDPSHGLTGLVNQGTIRVTEGGFVALVSPLIDQRGLIVAQGGQVALGAASEATLNFDGRGLLELVLPQGFRGSRASPPVPRGTVLLTEDQAGEVLRSVVSVRGLVEAGSIADNLSQVRLGGTEGVLLVQGQISADGRAGLAGGTIQLDSSQATLLSPTSRVSARGLQSDGGRITALSAGTTVAAGCLDVSATGQGQAGFVEVSGQRVRMGSLPDLSAQSGRTGMFVLDPGDVTIVAGSGSLDGNVTGGDVNWTDAGTNATLGQAALQSATGTLIINATGNLTSGVDLQFTNPLDLTLSAGSNLLLHNVTLQSPSKAALTLKGGNVTVGDVQVTGASALVFVDSEGRLTASSIRADAGPTGQGEAKLEADGLIQVPNGIFASTRITVDTTGEAYLGGVLRLSPSQATGSGVIEVTADQLFGRDSSPSNWEMYATNASVLNFHITGVNLTGSTPPSAARINIINPTAEPVPSSRLESSSVNTTQTASSGDIYLNGKLAPRHIDGSGESGQFEINERGDLSETDQSEILRELSPEAMGLEFKPIQFRGQGVTSLSHRDDGLYDFDTFHMESITVHTVIAYNPKADSLDRALDSIERNFSVLLGDGQNSFWRQMLEGFVIWEDE